MHCRTHRNDSKHPNYQHTSLIRLQDRRRLRAVPYFCWLWLLHALPSCSWSCCSSSHPLPVPSVHQILHRQVKDHLIPEAFQYCQHMCFDLQPCSGQSYSLAYWNKTNPSIPGGCRGKPWEGTPKYSQNIHSTNSQNTKMKLVFLSFGNSVIFHPLCRFYGGGSDSGKLKAGCMNTRTWSLMTSLQHEHPQQAKITLQSPRDVQDPTKSF